MISKPTDGASNRHKNEMDRRAYLGMQTESKILTRPSCAMSEIILLPLLSSLRNPSWLPKYFPEWIANSNGYFYAKLTRVRMASRVTVERRSAS